MKTAEEILSKITKCDIGAYMKHRALLESHGETRPLIANMAIEEALQAMKEFAEQNLYHQLAKVCGLTEVRTNQWVNEHGDYYASTPYGFQRIGQTKHTQETDHS